MGIVASLFLIAVGGIMRFAVAIAGHGFNIHTAGAVLMIIGVLGAILSNPRASVKSPPDLPPEALWWGPPSRRATPNPPRPSTANPPRPCWRTPHANRVSECR